MSGVVPFVAYESRVKLLLGLLGSCCFVGVGVFLLELRDPKSVVAGILGVGCFGLCATVFLIRVIRPKRLALTIDEAGFCDHRQTDAFLPWEAVTHASVVQVQRTRFIGVEFDRADRVPRKVAGALNAALGYSRFNIGLGFLDHKPDQVIEAFFSRLHAHAAAQSPRLSDPRTDGDLPR